MPNSVHRNYTIVIACTDNNLLDEFVLTEAYKTAKKNICEWKVLNVTTPENKISSQVNKQFKRIIKKAEILGAQIIEIEAANTEEGIMKYSESLNTDNDNILFLTRSDEELRLPLIYRKSPYSKAKPLLAKRNMEIKSVIVEKPNPVSNPFILPIFNYNALSGILETIIYILVASLISLIFVSFMPDMLIFSGIGDLYLIYLIACVLSAFRAGTLAGIVSSIISALTINFLYMAPRMKLSTDKPEDFVAMGIFFGCAIVVSLVSGSTRKYIIEARQKEAYLDTLLNLSETLNRPLQETEALVYIYSELKKLFGAEVAFYGPSLMKTDTLLLKYPELRPEFGEAEQRAFEKCQSEYIMTGFLTPNLPTSEWFFEPLLSSTGFKGILALKLSESALRFDSNITNIILSFADFTANLLDRIERTLSMEESKIEKEKEQLRTMLLSSVSHDLKTPLASIIGSLDVYESLNARLTEENKKTLLATAHQEAVRLDNFITNILDMAKLESGSVKINKYWVKLSGIMDKALVTISPRFKGRQVFNNVLKENIEVNVEPTLITRSLVNIFDNISKYTPDKSNIFIDYEKVNEGLKIIISDEGSGIEPHMLEEIFNKYTRIKQQDSKIAGTGLGLPIARYILQAHGGDITAANKEKGMAFTIILPEYNSEKAK